MNEAVKVAAIEAARLMALTFGVTMTAYVSVRLAQKVYGPIEVKHK